MQFQLAPADCRELPQPSNQRAAMERSRNGGPVLFAGFDPGGAPSPPPGSRFPEMVPAADYAVPDTLANFGNLQGPPVCERWP